MKTFKKLLLAFAITSVASCAESPKPESEDQSTVQAEGHDHEAMAEEASAAEFKKAPDGARVFFVNLKEGDKVKSPVKVVMGVEGITVHPAGEVIEGTGHHHIILEAPAVPERSVVPADDEHIHFGGGQTETEIELVPGPHTLRLQFADGLHRSYGEALSAMVMIEVIPNE